MKTAILVGAGATVADSTPKYPSYALTPPLDLTFFKQTAAAKYKLLSSVRKYMRTHHAIDPIEQPSTRLEEVFNYIFSDVHIGSPDPESLNALWNLLRLYNRSIADCTNYLLGNSSYGVFGLVRKLLNKDPELELAFVTYNQDLMIEKSLARLKARQVYSHIKFSIEKCYKIKFVKVVGVQEDSTLLPVGDEGSIPILKLHGSLNWVYFARSDTDARNILRTTRRDLCCIQTEKLYMSLRWRPPGRKRTVHLLPVVVPPIYEKSRHYESILSPIREHARQELQTAERIIIFGYSFPDADFMARSMISSALCRSKQLRDLIVIDINPEMCTRTAKLCRTKTLRFATDVPSLVL